MSASIAIKAIRSIVAALLIGILCACGTSPTSSVPVPAGSYVVRQGDTLSGIARRFGQSVGRLERLNGLKDANDIKVGQVLRVSSRRGAASTAASAPKPTPARERPEAVEADAGPAPHDWVWPTDGAVTSAFGQKKGIEISGSSGQTVRAANDGKVSFVGGGIRGYGNLVIIKHSGNMLSVYAHNKTVLVKEGDAVVKGQKIAEMGDSDSSTVKLYFEIRRNGKPVNPGSYLPNK